MKNSKLIFITPFLFLFLTVTSFSQGSLSFGLGAAFPIGDFAANDINNDNAGGAATGLNLDFNYVYSFSESGLGLFGGLDLCYNGLRTDVKNSIEKEFEGMGIYNADYQYYSYFNIPVSAGLNYTQKVRQNISLFTNLGIAASFLKMSDMVIKVSSQQISMEFKPDIRLGFKISGGFILNKTSISVNYLSLGKHNIKATMISAGNSQEVEGKQKVGIVTLTLGIKI